MKKVDLNNQELDMDTLRRHTRNMSEPCIFNNVAIGQDLEHCSVEEILSLHERKFHSSLHNGSYWANNPLQAMVQGRKNWLDLEKMFRNNQGEYYVTYFQSSNVHPTGWVTARTCGNNEFDNYLGKKTAFKDYMKGAYLHNHWISNGGTISSLHADPVDTLFLQIQGIKKFRIIPESIRLSLMADFRQPHKLRYKTTDLDKMNVGLVEFTLKPGNAVFMPAWCFHEIESEKNALNISLTTHYERKRRFFSFSPFNLINRFRRVIYPKLVHKKRIKFQVSNLTEHAIPFFPWHSSFVKNNTFHSDTSYQYEYLIVNQKKRIIQPVQNSELQRLLEKIDGFKSISELANSANIKTSFVIEACNQLIEDGFIQILFNAQDKYNYFYQTVESRK